MRAVQKKYHYQKAWKGQALHYIPIYMEIDQMEILILPLRQEGEEHLGTTLLQQSNGVMVTGQGCVEAPLLDSSSYFLRGQWGCDV